MVFTFPPKHSHRVDSSVKRKHQLGVWGNIGKRGQTPKMRSPFGPHGFLVPDPCSGPVGRGHRTEETGLNSRTINACAIVLFTLLCEFVGGCGTRSESMRATESEQPTAAQGARGEAVVTDEHDQVGRREDRLARADRFIESGETGKAAELLRELLVIDPQDVEVLFRLANVNAAEGNFEEAIRASRCNSRRPSRSRLTGAWVSQPIGVFSCERYEQAEQAYRKILEVVPDASRARRQLAYLLNRQGRRHEAAEQIRELCRQGDIRQDELHSLIVRQ